MKSLKELSASLVVELIGREIVDPEAITIAEISEQAGKNRTKVMRAVNEQIKAGRLEKVFKRMGRQLVPAYRIKRT